MQQFVFPKALRRDGIVQRLAHTLLALPADKAWCVEIREHKPRRSSQQNRYLWGVVYPTIARQLDGFDNEDVHEYMLGECFGWEMVKGFGRKRMKPLKRSAKLNKQEFSDYVAFIQRRAAEHGIFVPDADPEYWHVEAA